MSDDIRYSRWYTPRTAAANALDILGTLADFAAWLTAGYVASLALAAELGWSDAFTRHDGPALSLLALAAVGAGRIATLLLNRAADALDPGWGVLPTRYAPQHNDPGDDGPRDAVPSLAPETPTTPPASTADGGEQ